MIDAKHDSGNAGVLIELFITFRGVFWCNFRRWEGRIWDAERFVWGFRTFLWQRETSQKGEGLVHYAKCSSIVVGHLPLPYAESSVKGYLI